MNRGAKDQFMRRWHRLDYCQYFITSSKQMSTKPQLTAESKNRTLISLLLQSDMSDSPMVYRYLVTYLHQQIKVGILNLPSCFCHLCLVCVILVIYKRLWDWHIYWAPQQKYQLFISKSNVEIRFISKCLMTILSLFFSCSTAFFLTTHFCQWSFVFTQFYGFKYSHLTPIISKQFYGCK